MILFLVKRGNACFLCLAPDREEAKRQASQWLGCDPERYVVTPITNTGDRIRIGITVQI